VAERKKELAILESTDCGKPIDESEWDMVNKLLHQPLLFPYLLELLCFYYHTQFEQCAWLFATLGCPLFGNLVLIQLSVGGRMMCRHALSIMPTWLRSLMSGNMLHWSFQWNNSSVICCGSQLGLWLSSLLGLPSISSFQYIYSHCFSSVTFSNNDNLDLFLSLAQSCLNSQKSPAEVKKEDGDFTGTIHF
jgi:hypothetical protein